MMLLLVTSLTARAEDVTVFASTSLEEAMRAVVASWVETGHKAPRLSFNTSAALVRKIRQGAPANLFATADGKAMEELADADLLSPGTRRDLLSNELIAVVPSNPPPRMPLNPNLDLMALLGTEGRLAIADPARVAAGRYARQALSRLGLWDSLSPRLVIAPDARSALQMVERGEARAGIVYATDVITAPAVTVAGILAGDSHDPITYTFALTSIGATQEARDFLDYLSSSDAGAIWRNYGFKMDQ